MQDRNPKDMQPQKAKVRTAQEMVTVKEKLFEEHEHLEHKQPNR